MNKELTMRWMLVGFLLVFPAMAWANGWARIDQSTKRILYLSEWPFTVSAPSGQQDVPLLSDATSFAKANLGGKPQEWTLDPVTLVVSHDFAPQPTASETERAKDPKTLTDRDRIKRLEIILGVN